MSIMERKELEELFTENVLAKLVNVARNGLINNVRDLYPLITSFAIVLLQYLEPA